MKIPVIFKSALFHWIKVSFHKTCDRKPVTDHVAGNLLIVIHLSNCPHEASPINLTKCRKVETQEICDPYRTVCTIPIFRKHLIIKLHKTRQAHSHNHRHLPLHLLNTQNSSLFYVFSKFLKQALIHTCENGT